MGASDEEWAGTWIMFMSMFSSISLLKVSFWGAAGTYGDLGEMEGDTCYDSNKPTPKFQTCYFKHEFKHIHLVKFLEQG